MKLVIVEDEFMVAKRLKRMLTDILDGQEYSLQLFNTLDDAADYLSDNIVDALFLDLNLNGENGFSLLQQQLSHSFHTIVVSANTDRAMEAFELGVLDFVGKPFTQERLQQAVERLTEQNYRTQCKFLSYKKAGSVQRLAVNQIEYIQAAGHYSEIFIEGTEHPVLHDKNLEKLLPLLPTNFLRIHRSYIVDLKAVKAMTTQVGSKYFVTLHNGKALPVGRTRVAELREKMT